MNLWIMTKKYLFKLTQNNLSDEKTLELIMSLMQLDEEKRKEICILLMSTTFLNTAHVEQTAGYMVGLTDKDRE